jgi:hypothetical protein
MGRITIGLCVGTLAIIACGGADASAAEQPPAPPGAHVARFLSEGLTIRAREDSGCLPEDNGLVLCFDDEYIPGPTTGRLPIAPGRILRVRLGAPADSVSLQLFHTKPNGQPQPLASRRAQRVGTSGEVWQIRLPRSAARADVVYAGVTYPYGDDSFSSRVRNDARCGMSH